MAKLQLPPQLTSETIRKVFEDHGFKITTEKVISIDVCDILTPFFTMLQHAQWWGELCEINGVKLPSLDVGFRAVSVHAANSGQQMVTVPFTSVNDVLGMAKVWYANLRHYGIDPAIRSERIDDEDYVALENDLLDINGNTILHLLSLLLPPKPLEEEMPIMGFHRPEPTGILLDTSALRNLNGDKLRQISEEHQIYVPWSIFRELFTTEDKSIVNGNLQKLLPLNGVAIDELSSHLKFELAEGKSSGILLVHSDTPGFPEKTYPLLVEKAIGFFNSDSGDDKESLANYGISDRQDESKWLNRCQNMVSRLNELPDMPKHRQDLGGRYFETPDEIQKVLSEWFREDFSKMKETKVRIKENFPVDSVNSSWAFNRFLFGVAWYHILNANDNPPNYNHDRLNQRMDLTFITFLHPGLKLLSTDKGMQKIALCLHGPDALYKVE